VSLPGGTTNHQGAQFEEARIESSEERNPVDAFSAKPFENILIDEEKRLDRSYLAFVVNNREISVLELIPEGIVEDFVIPIVFSLVGESRRPGRASGQIGTRYNGNRERFTARAGNAWTNGAHVSTPQGSGGIHNPARRRLFHASWLERWRRFCHCK
jgi:hypothetical protein